MHLDILQLGVTLGYRRLPGAQVGDCRSCRGSRRLKLRLRSALSASSSVEGRPRRFARSHRAVMPVCTLDQIHKKKVGQNINLLILKVGMKAQPHQTPHSPLSHKQQLQLGSRV